jgi:hypothetical protein
MIGAAQSYPTNEAAALGQEAMATVAERSHADILPDAPLAPDPVSATMPVFAPEKGHLLPDCTRVRRFSACQIRLDRYASGR